MFVIRERFYTHPVLLQLSSTSRSV